MTLPRPHQGLDGHWVSILKAESIDEALLDGRQHPCPVCGGKDRFRFDDKGEGRWYCNHCGSGDGYSLLCRKFGYSFVEAKAKVQSMLGILPERAPAKRAMSNDKKRELMNRTWNNAKPEAPALREYLSGRGIPESLHFNPAIRWHPQLRYDETGAMAPAAVIKCYRWGIDGKPEPATLQRHWPSIPLKKMMPAPIKLDGIFCPLGGHPHEGVMGICEGYVTALSCMTFFPHPVWAAMSADQLTKFVPPPDVRKLVIFIDVDKSFTGQAAGYALAKHMKVLHPDLEVAVQYPTYKQDVDFDFNDLLKQQGSLP